MLILGFQADWIKMRKDGKVRSIKIGGGDEKNNSTWEATLFLPINSPFSLFSFRLLSNFLEIYTYPGDIYPLTKRWKQVTEPDRARKDLNLTVWNLVKYLLHHPQFLLQIHWPFLLIFVYTFQKIFLYLYRYILSISIYREKYRYLYISLQISVSIYLSQKGREKEER